MNSCPAKPPLLPKCSVCQREKQTHFSRMCLIRGSGVLNTVISEEYNGGKVSKNPLSMVGAGGVWWHPAWTGICGRWQRERRGGQGAGSLDQPWAPAGPGIPDEASARLKPSRPRQEKARPLPTRHPTEFPLAQQAGPQPLLYPGSNLELGQPRRTAMCRDALVQHRPAMPSAPQRPPARPLPTRRREA